MNRIMRNLRTLPQLLVRIFVLPVFPFLQWLGRVSGLAKEAKTVEGLYRRQPYLLGTLVKEISVERAKDILISRGFFLHRMAYPDPGQAYSLRRLDDVHPDFQYHLRIFKDGEVRGHYEYTPEDHPIDHLNEVIHREEKEQFLIFTKELLG